MPETPQLLEAKPSGLSSVVQAVEKLSGAEFRQVDSPDHRAFTAPFVVLPSGKTVKSLKAILDEFAPRPVRRTGVALASSPAAFIELTKRHRHENLTVVFADASRTAPKLLTIFDYHAPTDDHEEAEWCEHRALYNCALSEEWKTWHKVNAQWQSQAEFAAFIEDRMPDVVAVNEDAASLADLASLLGSRFATPGELLTLSRGLQVHSEITVRSAVTLNTGEISVTYEDKHKENSAGSLGVPHLFAIAIPVFYQGVSYRLAARLRYRVNNGALQWCVQLFRSDRAFDHAFKELTDKVRTEANVPVFEGWPSA